MDTDTPIYLIDDDARIRESIRMLLKSVGLSLQTYGSAQEFLDVHDSNQDGGVLILDIRMPGMSGLELQQRLRERGDNMAVIMLSGHGDVPMAVRALQAGALDFLEKPFNDQVLLDRIQQGAQEVKRRGQVQAAQSELRQRMEELTPREREVMELLVSGLPNKDIATKLNISRKTLDIHRSKVLQKMQAETIADLVRMVLQYRCNNGVKI
jgi:RNA polymerase sigma factor (sigma-70 family)